MSAAPAPGLRFTKMHGAGNDFVVLDLRADPALAARLDADGGALCRALADRHRGAGCDQVIAIAPPRAATSVASYRVWNADGSSAGQCGNGARCVAAFVAADADAAAVGNGFAIDGPQRTHAVSRVDGGFAVSMGAPAFAPDAVPLRGFDAADAYRLEIDGATVRFGAASMGNPHAVIEVGDIATAPVATLGPALQAQAAFPDSVNVGFAQVLAADAIALRVYERGAGETLACGSGACAAVAVLVRQRRLDPSRPVRVDLPGGSLRIHYDPRDGGDIRMAGPAAFVYEGTWRA